MLDPAGFAFVETAMVRPVAYETIFSISAYRATEKNLSAALNIKFPGRPEWVRDGNAIYLWAGLHSWLAIDVDPTALRQAEPYAAITDQSDGRILFEIAGLYARQALAKLVPIDLHETVFPVGSTALTLAGHINVQIWRESDRQFKLACFRSFANALYHALTTASYEFES